MFCWSTPTSCVTWMIGIAGYLAATCILSSLRLSPSGPPVPDAAVCSAWARVRGAAKTSSRSRQQRTTTNISGVQQNSNRQLPSVRRRPLLFVLPPSPPQRPSFPMCGVRRPRQRPAHGRSRTHPVTVRTLDRHGAPQPRSTFDLIAAPPARCA